MKTPKFLSKLSKLSAMLTTRPKNRLQATARAARPAMDHYDEEEPTTNLSSAFVIVLVLHVVAVGGIYAFNSIKASRKEHDTTPQIVEQAAPAPPKTIAKNDATASAPAATHPAASAPATTHPADAAPVPALALAKPAVGRTYQVKANDNLTKISLAYGVTPSEIMEANHLKEGALLHPGKTLTIPAAKASSKTADTHKTDATPKQADIPPTATTPGLYTVKKGDTLTSVAHNFGLSTEDLLKANKITDAKKLQIGQTLKVPPRKDLTLNR
jgi:LysM repeat protein